LKGTSEHESGNENDQFSERKQTMHTAIPELNTNKKPNAMIR